MSILFRHQYSYRNLLLRLQNWNIHLKVLAHSILKVAHEYQEMHGIRGAAIEV